MIITYYFTAYEYSFVFQGMGLEFYYSGLRHFPYLGPGNPAGLADKGGDNEGGSSKMIFF